ncbi:MAG TPA: GNAT family N-acetyltransferase [Chitinophagaceae bacterium]|jgi:ribosomal-protein-alanine N-acetyltransferase
MLNLNFTPFPDLITERLILRRLQTEDANEIFVLRSSDEVNRFLGRPKATTIDEARQFINKINNAINKNESVYWAITLKPGTRLIGTICCWNISKENEQAEIGYELHPEFQGKGIMQEAILKVIDFGFEQLKLKTIIAVPSCDNIRSRKLLEKINFKIDSNLQIQFSQQEHLDNMVVYSLTK